MWTTPLVFLCLIPLLGPVARGAGFGVSLELSDAKTRQSATTQPSSAPQKPPAPRPVMKSAPAATCTARWEITRTAKDPAEDVLVHFYVVRIDREGQAAPPLEPKRVPVEAALTMDFPAAQKCAGKQEFRIDQPGVYLVRVEVRPNSQPPGGEDYAAIDLVVK